MKRWVNGMDLTRRPAGKWIVDFGWSMAAGDAALYEEPFRWVQERVHPMRQQNRRGSLSAVLAAACGWGPNTVPSRRVLHSPQPATSHRAPSNHCFTVGSTRTDIEIGPFTNNAG